MRLVVAIFLVALGRSSLGHSLPKSEINPFMFEEEIYGFCSCLIGYLKENNYRAVEVPEVDIDFDCFQIGDIRGSIGLTNLKLKDLSLINIRNLEIELSIVPLGLSIKGTLDAFDLELETQYEADVTENESHMFGNGDLNVRILDIAVDLSLTIGISTEIEISDFSFGLSTGPSRGYITGYIDEEETQKVNDIINNIEPWLEENGEILNEIVDKYLGLLLSGDYTPCDNGEGGGEEEELPNVLDDIFEKCGNMDLGQRRIKI